MGICTTRKKKLKNNKIDSITYCKLNDIINNPVLFPTEFKYEFFFIKVRLVFSKKWKKFQNFLN